MNADDNLARYYNETPGHGDGPTSDTDLEETSTDPAPEFDKMETKD